MKKKYVATHNLIHKESSWPSKQTVMAVAGEAFIVLLFLAGICAAVLTLAGY